jgi:uncharacterized protein YdeI (YjbR/CyaY-like superfamily)
MPSSLTSAEAFILAQENWAERLMSVHEMAIALGFSATIKWGRPVYQLEKTNLIGFFTSKNFMSIAFFQGVFLEDKAGHLINAQKGKIKAMRHWRFMQPEDLDLEEVKQYFLEVKSHFDAGTVFKREKGSSIKIPNILAQSLEENEDLKKAFQELTPFKQREYTTYIAEAKRDQTKLDRLIKIQPMILSGVGLNDKYRK